MDPTQAKKALQDWYDQATAGTADEQSLAKVVARQQAIVARGLSYIDDGRGAATAADPAVAARAEALRTWGTRRAID